MPAQLDPPLDAAEVRVLGALIEKEITTPEYYPLSLNALANACNQKTNREPVTAYAEDDMREALERLRHRGLAFVRTGAGSRVEKFGHRLQEHCNFSRGETAVLTVLMLRGPQTLGEIRDRTERMHRFDDLEQVERVLRGLAERAEGALTRQLPRASGTKEARWAHLLGGEPAAGVDGPAAPPLRSDRLAEIEAELARLRADVDELRAAMREVLDASR